MEGLFWSDDDLKKLLENWSAEQSVGAVESMGQRQVEKLSQSLEGPVRNVTLRWPYFQKLDDCLQPSLNTRESFTG
jgi:hypothetical protein